MKECGANYLLVRTPNYYKSQMTYSSIHDFYTTVADKSPIPILINNFPLLTFIDLPAELCIELAEHPNIVGLKESAHNVN
jgi:4-hydroxy-2-oxoglutarate aldolase